MVEWSKLFAELVRVGYAGPLSVHAEYETASREEFWASLKDEVAYFRGKLKAAIAK